jgi:tetratricopeptide (TPR) repeat protein
MKQLFFWCLLLLIISSRWSYGQDIAHLEQQLQKSIAAFEKGQVPKAERLLNKIIAAEGSYAPAYVWKGKCLQAFEEYSAAYEAYYTACRLQPDVAGHWLALGDFKNALGSLSIRKPGACGDCGKQFLPLNDERPSSAAYFRSAVVDYQQALVLDNKLAQAHYQLGLTQQALGDKEAACRAMTQAARLKHTEAATYQQKNCGNAP